MNTPFLITSILFTAACQHNMQGSQASQLPGYCEEQQQHTSLLEQCEEEGISCEELDQLVESIENECPELLEKSEADEHDDSLDNDETLSAQGSISYAEKLHDPSSIAHSGESLVMVATEPLLDENTQESAFLLFEYSDAENGWLRHESVFPYVRDNVPSPWISDRFGGTEYAYWAPAMPSATEIYYSIYELSNPGHACIGYATTQGSGSDATWIDAGSPVVCTAGPESATAPVAIDPAIFADEEGERWMVWGSHGAGIYINRIDSDTGLLPEEVPTNFSADVAKFHFVANNEEGEDSATSGIEAPFVWYNNGYYYLFVNFGACCGGVSSTYNIRVGRAENPEGPYLDHDGIDMREGGGTLFLSSSDRFIGPGHAGIFKYGENQLVFSYHFYDMEHDNPPSSEYNWASMAIRSLHFEQGWPVLGSELSGAEILRTID